MARNNRGKGKRRANPAGQEPTEAKVHPMFGGPRSDPNVVRLHRKEDGTTELELNLAAAPLPNVYYYADHLLEVERQGGVAVRAVKTLLPTQQPQAVDIVMSMRTFRMIQGVLRGLAEEVLNPPSGNVATPSLEGLVLTETVMASACRVSATEDAVNLVFYAIAATEVSLASTPGVTFSPRLLPVAAITVLPGRVHTLLTSDEGS